MRAIGVKILDDLSYARVVLVRQDVRQLLAFGANFVEKCQDFSSFRMLIVPNKIAVAWMSPLLAACCNSSMCRLKSALARVNSLSFINLILSFVARAICASIALHR